MWMAAHVHKIALKFESRVVWMQRIDLRVLRSIQVVRIVALNRLKQKRNPQGQYEQSYYDRT